MPLDPAELVAQFDLQSGARVADLGCGSGSLTLAAARAVGDSGRVYAVEVQKELLERLQGEARRAQIHNIEVLWGDAERPMGTHLKEGSIDAAIAAHILFQLDDRAAFAEEARRILRPGGRLFVVENAGVVGQGVPEAETSALFMAHGFSLVKNIEVGRGQCGMMFKKELRNN